MFLAVSKSALLWIAATSGEPGELRAATAMSPSASVMIAITAAEVAVREPVAARPIAMPPPTATLVPITAAVAFQLNDVADESMQLF